LKHLVKNTITRRGSESH